MTIGEGIYAVLDGTGYSTDDWPIRKRFIYNELKFAYRELIKQELNKNRLWDGSAAQTLLCLELEERDASACFDCPTGLKVLRSKTPLPAVVEADAGIGITNVYLTNGVPIEKVTKQDWVNRQNRRYKLPDIVGFFLINDFLNVVGYDSPELLVDVEAFYEDPEIVEAANLKYADCTKDQKCKAVHQLDFTCPGHLQRRVIEIARSVVFRKLGIPLDDSNNAKFDPNSQIPSNVKSQTQP